MPELQEMWLDPLGGKDPVQEEMVTPLQDSCLGTPMDRGTWWAGAHWLTAESDSTRACMVR